MVRRFSFQLNRRLSALTRRRVGLSLQDGELWAGEMSRPAGFSAGRGACARGGCSARRGNSGLGAGRFAVIHAGACGSIAVFCRRFTPVFFPLSGKKRQLAISCVSIPPWVEIAIRAFSRRSSVISLCGFTSGLCVYLWRSRRVTGDARNQRTGLRGWRRGACALLRGRIGFVMLSAGSTLGLRAPNLRQRVFDSLDSLHAAAGLC